MSDLLSVASLIVAAAGPLTVAAFVWLAKGTLTKIAENATAVSLAKFNAELTAEGDKRRKEMALDVEAFKAERGHASSTEQQAKAFVRAELAKSYSERKEVLTRFLALWQSVYRTTDVSVNAKNARVVERGNFSAEVLLAFRDDTIAADVGSSLFDAERLASASAQQTPITFGDLGAMYNSSDHCIARMIDSINTLGVDLGLPPFVLTEKRAALIEAIKAKKAKE